MRSRYPNLDEYDRLMSELPIRESCLFCEWGWEGPAAEGRLEAIAHRLRDHPEVKPTRRRQGRHLKSFRQAPLTEEDVSDLLDERRKRARLLGIELAEEVV